MYEMTPDPPCDIMQPSTHPPAMHTHGTDGGRPPPHDNSVYKDLYVVVQVCPGTDIEAQSSTVHADIPHPPSLCSRSEGFQADTCEACPANTARPLLSRCTRPSSPPFPSAADKGRPPPPPPYLCRSVFGARSSFPPARVVSASLLSCSLHEIRGKRQCGRNTGRARANPAPGHDGKCSAHPHHSCVQTKKCPNMFLLHLFKPGNGRVSEK